MKGKKMVIFRPHRGTLTDAMAEKQEFNNMYDMFNYLRNQYGKDIKITLTDPVNDERIGWKDSMYVNINNWKDSMYVNANNVYIGMCATDYTSDIDIERKTV